MVNGGDTKENDADRDGSTVIASPLNARVTELWTEGVV